MNPRRVVLRAPAKINLSLGVLGRRADGFHEVDTVLLALELWDRLEVCRAGSGGPRLVLSGPASAGVPVDGSNLALRAARIVFERAGASAADVGLELRLEKRVPAAAGLGGGSSDAAAALLGSALVLGLDPDDPSLGAGLAELGSDCAFFLAARDTGMARCTGRGERVQALDAVFPWVVALVTPSFGCSTAAAYGAYRGDSRGVPMELRDWTRSDLPLEQVQAQLSNDLEPAALRSCAGLLEVHELLEELEPGAFHLSGSGSSFFALFAEASSAQRVLERVRVASEARRCALRGAWVLRAAGRGPHLEASTSQLEPRAPA